MVEFDSVSRRQIYAGDATDAYFEQTEAALDAADHNPYVKAEVTADQYADGDYEVFAGLKDATALLEGLPIDVYALPEGTLFDGGPVLRIEGNYRDFAEFETSLLGFLSHASGMATNALDARLAAPDTPILSFGARHVHPMLAQTVERSALIAGFDGFSHVAAGDVLDRKASGTMPHALVLSMGDRAAAWEAFNDGVDEDTPRLVIADTQGDEVEEVLHAVEILGEDLDGVRLDTTGSRRGRFRDIIREVRWELDAIDRSDVDIYVSGGLGPENLRELRDIVDGFGVGGHVSNANPVDFGLDIVEVDGEDTSKRGKLPGVKRVYRKDGDHCRAPADTGDEDLLEPVILDGTVKRVFNINDAAARVRKDAAALDVRDD